ncbi:S-layer homology domain-containing protein [Cohnella zeiphila]|uniref:S-layer homology domain-containing protein n=1 Tax=Cohnella zeiphila TaxID=2761120 RepID=A0A7X0VXC6_9BACL|nr:S-layer homology domain-containing protein [Cohnella zeiphila]MBB6734139.1 S-layer homology domain-containing protein [Cohnella zeiphila]
MKSAKDDGRYYELNLVDYEIFREYLKQAGKVNNAVEGRIAEAKSAAGAAFADIAGDPHEDAIRQAAEKGIALGYEDGLFRSASEVTRAERQP